MYYFIKNLIGGTLLVVGVLFAKEFDLGCLIIFLSMPGWAVLFLGNEETKIRIKRGIIKKGDNHEKRG